MDGTRIRLLMMHVPSIGVRRLAFVHLYVHRPCRAVTVPGRKNALSSPSSDRDPLVSTYRFFLFWVILTFEPAKYFVRGPEEWPI